MSVTALRDRLEAPFSATELEWKVQTSGIKKDGTVWAQIVPYIAARACARRLDEVFDVTGWGVSYRHINYGETNGFIASIVIYRETAPYQVIKEDGSEITDIESLKGGISGAFKRACVALGIGRYLYDVPEVWAVIHDGGSNYAVHNDKKTGTRTPFKWDVPPDVMKQLAGEQPDTRSMSKGGGIPSAPSKPMSQSQAVAGSVVMPGKAGDHFKGWAGKPITDVPFEILADAEGYYLKASKIPEKARWKDQNEKALHLIQAEMVRRDGGDLPLPEAGEEAPLDETQGEY